MRNPQPSNPAQVLIKINGHVQGVFFRARAQEQAKKLNIKGYAKNLHDGSVVIVAQGEKENLEDLIAWCHDGSPSAKVKKVETSWETPQETFVDFSIG